MTEPVQLPKNKADQLTTPLARYTHSRRVGALLYVAGQGCRNPLTNDYAGLTRDPNGKVLTYDIRAQTASVLGNIEAVLITHGLDRSALVDIQVFLTDMADFEAMNEIWNQFFCEVSPPPTRTTVAVKQLPGLNFIEMKAIAHFKEPV